MNSNRAVPSSLSARPSRVYLGMVVLAMMVAVLLYLDRICLSTAAKSVQADLSIADRHWEWILSAFFLAYALAQVPAGWLGDRYGARWVLAAYVVLWSASTGLMGLANGWISLVILRLACGLFEAGAYPVSAGIIRRWVPLDHRGLASSVVAVGGRIGGALAPILTVQLMLLWSFGWSDWPTDGELVPTVTSWRPVMIFYGGIGILVAIAFVFAFRDWPEQHPRVNQAELEWIRGNLPQGAPSEGRSEMERNNLIPMKAMVQHRGLWLNCFVQFSANFGWAFLITLMPKFLSDVHHASLQNQGWAQSLPLFAGIAGLLIGGKLTDVAMMRWGARWGRAMTLVVSRGVVGLAFVGCLFVRNPLEAAICMAFVGFATDLGIAACWAYGQDVGGRFAGAVLGWSNMWGNLGAFASPIALGYLSRLFEGNLAMGWQTAFLFCALLQVLAAIAACFVDATHKIES